MRRMLLIAAKYKDACLHALAVSVFLCAFSPHALADERQYKIEAAYLYSFFNYIVWPGYDSPQKLHASVICVYDSDPIVPYLDYIRSKMENERTLTIRAVPDEGSFSGCHILFVRHRIPPRLEGALTKDTLLVFKPDDPLDRGGMIELSEDDDRIVIRINQLQLEQHGFHVSSRLLDLAQRVK